MNIFVDENIPLITVNELRKQGHDVTDIRGTADQGITDEDIWQIAQTQRRLLVTTDKGFASHRNEVHSGILIIRLKQPTRLKIHARAIQAVRKYSQEEWAGLTVVMRDVVQSYWKSGSSTK